MRLSHLADYAVVLMTAAARRPAGARLSATELAAETGVPLPTAQKLMGQLAGNPFPDATPAFLAAMARALSLGLGDAIEVETPFAAMRKADVIRLGRELGIPFELTLSCMQPRAGVHCGRCSKCRERRDAFRDAGVADPTPYREKPLR